MKMPKVVRSHNKSIYSPCDFESTYIFFQKKKLGTLKQIFQRDFNQQKKLIEHQNLELEVSPEEKVNLWEDSESVVIFDSYES